MATVEPLYYHTIELPDGLHQGSWDCRPAVDAYLGRVDLAGKTVLEVGPANGFFTFEMERRGASVTCVDLGPNDSWDLVPGKYAKLEDDVRRTLARTGEAFRQAHRALDSKAKMVHGRVYDIPRLVGNHQVGVIGDVLQHLRDPIGALMALSERVTETIVVTETLWANDPALLREAVMMLVPRADIAEICQSWWQVSVPLVRETLRLLGFPHLKVEYHDPLLYEHGAWRPVRHMTWTGSRQPFESEIGGWLSGFFGIEQGENMRWIWAAGPSSGIEVSIPEGVRGSLEMRIFWSTPGITMTVKKDGADIAVLTEPRIDQDLSIPLEGAAQPISLQLCFDRWNGQPAAFAAPDPRPISLAFTSIRVVTPDREVELMA